MGGLIWCYTQSWFYGVRILLRYCYNQLVSMLWSQLEEGLEEEVEERLTQRCLALTSATPSRWEQRMMNAFALTSYQPLLGATAVVTGGAEAVWVMIRDHLLGGVDRYRGASCAGRCTLHVTSFNRKLELGLKNFPGTADDDAVCDWIDSSDAFNIRKVAIEDNELITVQAVKALADCYWLEELTIGARTERVSGDVMLFRNLVNLKYLDIGMCGGITGSRQELLDALPILKAADEKLIAKREKLAADLAQLGITPSQNTNASLGRRSGNHRLAAQSAWVADV